MKFISTLYFILYTLYSYSQFNVIVEDTTDNHLYTQTIIENNNEYTIINGSGDDAGNRGISIIRTDSSGTIIEEKIYSKNSETWNEGFNHCFNKDLKVLAGSIFLEQRRGKLYFFDNNYDTLFTKELILDTLISAHYAINKTYDNNIIVSGQIQLVSGTHDASILKYDLNGNLLWSKTYGGSQTDMLGNKIIETYDSSLISIGNTYSYSSAIYKQDWYIVKTDSMGNLDWWMHPGNPQLNDGSAADIIQTKDSCFVVVGGKAVYRDAGGTKFDGRIMKFDIDGNIIWDTTYRKRLYLNADTVWCFFNSIVELDDGGFMVVGNEKIDNAFHKEATVLYRFNSEGDTLWTRKYCTICEYAPTSPYAQLPYKEYGTTIQKTDNNGFLIGGWGYYDGVIDPYTQQMFLIKTDSLGCDGTLFSCPDTGVYVSEIAEQEGFLVFPNPATNTLNINAKHLAGAMHFHNKEVFIYDVFGRVVRVIASGAWQSVQADSREQSSRYDVLNIDVSTLPKGVYFVKVGNLTQKFVKM